MRTVLADPLAGRRQFPRHQGNERAAQQKRQYRSAPGKRVSFDGIPLGLLLESVPLGDEDKDMVKRSILTLRCGPIRFRRNKMIAYEGESADYVFLVVKGVVRSCKTFVDGGRGVIAFHLPGDLFGWTGEHTHLLSAEAATDALVLFVKRSALLAAAACNSAIANFVMTNTATELRRVQQHALLISRDAKCRVASFVTDIAARTGQNAHIDLPMSHQDIADYLGLSIETLSRTITGLEQCGSIARAPHRMLILKDPASLARMLS
jgi:CRP/FNR family nitrogen fixation transcriptional regulator